MGASSPAPAESNPASPKKHGPGDILKAFDEVSKWHGRVSTVLWLLGVLGFSPLLVKLTDAAASYRDILIKTAPLTVVVILLILLYRSNEFNFPGFVIATIVLLAAAAYLSKLLGKPIPWEYPKTGSSFPEVAWGLLSALVSAYFRVYGGVPFFISLATGLLAGFWLSGGVSKRRA